MSGKILPITPGGGNPNSPCAMEYVHLLAQQIGLVSADAAFTDLPACTDRTLAYVCQRANDRHANDPRLRQFMTDILPRLLGSPDMGQRFAVKAAVLAARRVWDLMPAEGHRAVETAEAWLRGEATATECRDAAAAAYPGGYYVAYCVARAADAAAYGAYGAAADAADAAARAAVAGPQWWIDYIGDLLDLYDKHTADEGAALAVAEQQAAVDHATDIVARFIDTRGVTA